MANEFLSYEEWMSNAMQLQKTPEQYLEALGFSPEVFADFSQRATDAFSQMLFSGENDDVLSRFRYAFEFRKKDPSFIETRGVTEVDRVKGALDKALSSIETNRYGLIPDNRQVPVDSSFKGILREAFPGVIEAQKGIVSLATHITRQGSSIEQVDQFTIVGLIGKGMGSYWDRTPVHLLVEAA